MINNDKTFIKSKILKNKIITLCGSTKFQKEFEEVNKKLTLEGYIVLSVGLFSHQWENDKLSFKEKQLLNAVHLQKIDLCDAIYVINVNNYIGESTRNEIKYAKEHNKEIYYLCNS